MSETKKELRWFSIMDYEKEAKLMLNPSHQEKCAEAVCKAVCEYFGMKYVSKTDSFIEKDCDSLSYVRNVLQP